MHKKYRVRPGEKVRLKDWATHDKPLYRSKAHYEELLQQQIREMSELQGRLYADNRYALLLIFQAMDAAGKDGAIKHVMSGVNPQGCQVFSFKHPSAEELDHDFLWRTTRCLPERGRIGIFNRSYYEDVLIVRVHPELLHAQAIPDMSLDDVWRQRYHSISHLETHLHCNGTRIIKFFLHLSKEEQRKRFLSRIERPEKNWKFSLDDIRERGFWKQYMQAYQDCLEATSSDDSPWYVVPADDKENARLIIADIIVQTLRDLDLHYPKVDAAHKRNLAAARRMLLKQ
ncbi:MAG TPA: ADP-polyphosphate phosphotransferase [Steroidobacteraceae bacterium]|nr:ADP-polyphosphate phosphotransferase [Steroidobacteraceae bacterium]